MHDLTWTFAWIFNLNLCLLTEKVESYIGEGQCTVNEAVNGGVNGLSHNREQLRKHQTEWMKKRRSYLSTVNWDRKAENIMKLDRTNKLLCASKRRDLLLFNIMWNLKQNRNSQYISSQVDCSNCFYITLCCFLHFKQWQNSATEMFYWFNYLFIWYDITHPIHSEGNMNIPNVMAIHPSVNGTFH